MAKRKRKITKEEIAWWVYLAMMIALVIYGSGIVRQPRLC